MHASTLLLVGRLVWRVGHYIYSQHIWNRTRGSRFCSVIETIKTASVQYACRFGRNRQFGLRFDCYFGRLDAIVTRDVHA